MSRLVAEYFNKNSFKREIARATENYSLN